MFLENKVIVKYWFHSVNCSSDIILDNDIMIIWLEEVKLSYLTRAADVVLKGARIFLEDQESALRITFKFQTIDKAVLINTDGLRENCRLTNDPDDLYTDGRLEEKE